MDRVSRNISVKDCVDDELVDKVITIYGWKNNEGEDDLDTQEEMIKAQYKAIELSCGKVCDDLNVGIPLGSYDEPTSECVVAYFNDEYTTKGRQGRYIQIPFPNMELFESFDWQRFSYRPGSYYIYAQYGNSKGSKLAMFGSSEEECLSTLSFWRGFVLEQQRGVYFVSQPRLVKTKRVLELRLKRLTYFPTREEKEGRQNGRVIWVAPKGR